MSKKLYRVLMIILVIGIFAAIITNQDKIDNIGNTQPEEIKKTQVTQAEDAEPIPEKIFKGYYSREGNNAKHAETNGYNIYVKFYPNNRVIRLNIPYPYAKTVKPETIHKAFDNADKKSSGIAYIKDKFDVMEVKITAILDTFRWIDNQVMYDCGKNEPCKISFGDKSMTVLKPGMVVAHKINYELINAD